MAIPSAATEPALESSMLARAARILYTFADATPELSLTEVVRRTGLPRSSVHRILDQLVQLKALERDGSRYRLGLGLLELGTLAAHQNHLRKVALPHLRALHEATGAVVRLAVLDEHEVVYLEQVGGGPGPTRVGARQYAARTATGRAMLAYADHERVNGALAAAFARSAPRTAAAPPAGAERVRRELARVREHAVAVDREETRRGVVESATALRDPEGRPVAALSISGPAARLDVRRLTPPLLAAAGAMCRTLFTPRQRRVPTAPAPVEPPAPGLPPGTLDQLTVWARRSDWM